MTERSDHAPELSKTPTPWWQDGSTASEALKEPYFVSNGAFGYMTKIRDWLLFPLKQVDPMTCSEKVLNLMAWDANITRFSGETETIFRKRVKYAFQNAKDAGNKSGFEQIFERMDLRILRQRERVPEMDWDIIAIDVPGSTTENDVQLFVQLIGQYGRTCRRYETAILHPVEVLLAAAEFHGNWTTYHTFMEVDYLVEDTIEAKEGATEFNYHQQTFHAQWK